MRPYCMEFHAISCLSSLFDLGGSSVLWHSVYFTVFSILLVALQADLAFAL